MSKNVSRPIAGRASSAPRIELRDPAWLVRSSGWAPVSPRTAR